MCTVVTIQGAEKEKRRVSRRSETRGMNGRYSHLDGLKLQIRKQKIKAYKLRGTSHLLPAYQILFSELSTVSLQEETLEAEENKHMYTT